MDVSAHAAGKDVIDPFTRHGGHRKPLAVLRRVEAFSVVALRVIEKQGTVSAGNLDPRCAIVRIARWQIPAAADHHSVTPLSMVTVVNITSREPLIGSTVTVGSLRINPNWFGRPSSQSTKSRSWVDSMTTGESLTRLAIFLPRLAAEMAADQHGHDLAERAVDDLLLWRRRFPD